MGLETGTYINSLVATNPVGAVDPKSQGDDHIRLLKSTIKATFPNLSAAVTSDATELNLLDGATGLTGTGNTVRSASPTFTGTLTAATVAATTLTGAGSGITALSASNLGSGTVPDARFPATLPALSGANLTALNASSLASGSVADARLSANVPLINISNTFLQTAVGGATLRQQNSSTGTGAYAEVGAKNSARGVYLNALSTGFSGGFLTSGPTGEQTVLWNDGNIPLVLGTNSTSRFEISGAGAFDFKAGVVTTNNASASEVGFKGVPQNSQSVDYTAVLADAGKCLHQTGASKTFTIPANGSVAYPIGTVINFTTSNASGVTIAITTDTLRLAGVGTAGSRTLAQYGMAAAEKIAATEWYISGAGLT